MEPTPTYRVTLETLRKELYREAQSLLNDSIPPGNRDDRDRILEVMERPENAGLLERCMQLPEKPMRSGIYIMLVRVVVPADVNAPIDVFIDPLPEHGPFDRFRSTSGVSHLRPNLVEGTYVETFGSCPRGKSFSGPDAESCRQLDHHFARRLVWARRWLLKQSEKTYLFSSQVLAMIQTILDAHGLSSFEPFRFDAEEYRFAEKNWSIHRNGLTLSCDTGHLGVYPSVKVCKDQSMIVEVVRNEIGTWVYRMGRTRLSHRFVLLRRRDFDPLNVALDPGEELRSYEEINDRVNHLIRAFLEHTV